MSENEPCEYEIDERPILCSHCQNTRFHKGSAMLNTTTMTFLGLDWINRSAITLMCDKCGFIHWFAKPPDARKT
jgi:predicted nucleic-acid-binding Zn-ribbon protein